MRRSLFALLASFVYLSLFPILRPSGRGAVALIICDWAGGRRVQDLATIIGAKTVVRREILAKCEVPQLRQYWEFAIENITAPQDFSHGNYLHCPTRNLDLDNNLTKQLR